MEKKRAADRHAQRVLREKTRRHIEELEQKVQELSDDTKDGAALEAAKKRTLELETELRELRALFDSKHDDIVTSVLIPEYTDQSEYIYLFQLSK